MKKSIKPSDYLVVLLVFTQTKYLNVLFNWFYLTFRHKLFDITNETRGQRYKIKRQIWQRFRNVTDKTIAWQA